MGDDLSGSAETLLYKPDWEETKARYEAWWRGEVLDRVCIAVSAPKKEPRAVLPPRDNRSRWLDANWRIEAWEASLEATYFGGEAFPCPTILIGSPAFYGCELVFQETTIWAKKYIDWERGDSVQFKPDSEHWLAVSSMLEKIVERAKGRFFVGIPTIGSPTDTLSSLRTAGELCLDIILRPQRLRAVLSQLQTDWFRIYNHFHRLTSRHQSGSSAWLSVWSPGTYYPLQCDFSCMISAKQFEEFVLPEIEAQSTWLDHSLYHLDGPGAIHHLDALLSLEELDGIQWVPGAGSPPPMDWEELLLKIQKAGKNLHISIAIGDVEKALRRLKPEGLFIATSASSPEEAEELLATARKLLRTNR